MNSRRPAPETRNPFANATKREPQPATYWKPAKAGEFVAGVVAGFRDGTYRGEDGKESPTETIVISPAVIGAPGQPTRRVRELRVNMNGALAVRIDRRRDVNSILGIYFTGMEPTRKGNESRGYDVYQLDGDQLGQLWREAEEAELSGDDDATA